MYVMTITQIQHELLYSLFLFHFFRDDFNRIVHYNHGELVAVGSFDRHVRFLDVNSGHETGPLITGHAGSIKSLYINEKDGYVLSGSFDTSIR